MASGRNDSIDFEESQPLVNTFDQSHLVKRPIKKSFDFRSAFLTFLFSSFFWGIILLIVVHLTSIPSRIHQGNSPQPVKHHSQEQNIIEDVAGPSHSIISESRFIVCPNSTEQAKAMGCKYDILSNHWVPGECYDEAAIEDYKSDGTWFGYADKEWTKKISIEEMGEGPVYYSNMRDHIVHCAALWRKQFRALFEERKNLDSIIVDRKHTDHCSDFLIRVSNKFHDHRADPISVEVGYAGCYIKD